MLSPGMSPHPGHRPPRRGCARPGLGLGLGPRRPPGRAMALSRVGGTCSRRRLVRASFQLSLPARPAPGRAAEPRPWPPASPPSHDGSPARPAAAPHLVLREPRHLRLFGCHVRAHAGRTAPPRLQRRERGRGGGGAAAAAAAATVEAHPGSARGRCRGARREGAGRALRGCARGLGGWVGASVAGLREQGSSSGARVAGARARAEGWGAGRRRPAAPGGGGGGTWLFRRETTLRFCKTTGLPGSPPRLGPVSPGD